MEFIYNKVRLYVEDVEDHRQYHRCVQNSISEEITDIYRNTNNTNAYETFLGEHFELVKDDNETLFQKYNSTMERYMTSYYSFIKLCILRKPFLGIEKDTCVFINYSDYDHKLIIFYLVKDNNNIELAKKIWLDNLNCGNYSREKFNRCYLYRTDKIIINDKEQYIIKEVKLESKIEIEIDVQENLTIREIK